MTIDAYATMLALVERRAPEAYASWHVSSGLKPDRLAGRNIRLREKPNKGSRGDER
jgi:hypothetical protein